MISQISSKLIVGNASGIHFALVKRKSQHSLYIYKPVL